MSEESFAQMLDNEEWKEIRTGEVVDGRVIAVKPDRIVLNIGGKSDGIITRSELPVLSSLHILTESEFLRIWRLLDTITLFFHYVQNLSLPLLTAKLRNYPHAR